MTTLTVGAVERCEFERIDPLQPHDVGARLQDGDGTVMKIGVSGWRMLGQPFGVKRYMQYLLRAWQSVASPSDELVLFVPEGLQPADLRGFESSRTRVCGPRMSNALWENLVLPRAARDMDVIFGPSYTVPLRGPIPSVVAIHSVDEAGKRFPSLKAWPYEEKYRRSARRARKVIANAQVVKDGIVACYGVPSEKVHVVHLAADAMFKPDRDPATIVAVKRRIFGEERPFALFVGGLSERRNVPMLMRAFAVAKKRERLPHALLLVGTNRARLPLDEMSAQLGIEGSVVQIDGKFADHSEIVSIYNAADVFVHPSSSEGFSLTLVEAMRCGIPVITVNRAGLGEIAQGHAMTIDEPDVDLLADALVRVLTDDHERRCIAERCLLRGQDFTWENTARRTLEIIRGVVE